MDNEKSILKRQLTNVFLVCGYIVIIILIIKKLLRIKEWTDVGQIVPVLKLYIGLLPAYFAELIGIFLVTAFVCYLFHKEYMEKIRVIITTIGLVILIVPYNAFHILKL